MPYISHRALTTPRSGIRHMFDKVLAKQHAGERVISFALGEPGFSAAPHVVVAGQRQLAGEMRYTDVRGIMPLREAIARYSATVKSLEFDPKTEIQVTPGATTALTATFLTLLDPGDEVVLCSPYFGPYLGQIHAAGGVGVDVPASAERDFHLDAATIEAAITDRTVAIVVNSPNNPAGAITPAEDLARIAHLAIDHDLWVISDEVYHRFAYDGLTAPSIATFPGMRERTIVIDSFSKTYAMTGWRIGYLEGPAELLDKIATVAEDLTSSTNSASQAAAVAALTGPQDIISEMHSAYDANRQLVVEAIDSCPALSMPTPEGAFYAFVDIRGTGLDADQFALGLLDEESVAVVPGEAFGTAGSGFVRLSYVGSAEETSEGLERIVRYASHARHPQAGVSAGT